MKVTQLEVARKLMTPARLEILKFLSNYQFGTTQQIWQELQPHKNRNHTGGDLNKLRSLGLIASFAYQPERGTNSELCWLLLAAGAKILEEAGYPFKFGNHYYRQPSRERIQQRNSELALAREVSYAQWQLIQPIHYSPTQPMPERTPQYLKLAEIVDWQEKQAIELARLKGHLSRQREIDYQDKIHLNTIPRRLNDYLAYRENRAAVLVLTSPEAGEHFWQSRLEKLERLGKKVAVVGLFEDKNQAEAYQKRLSRAGIIPALVSKVYEVLRDLAR